MINKAKRSFRASRPKLAHAQLNDGFTKTECTDMTFSFQVRNSYIKYILEDQTDQCIPFTIEGKWHLNFSKDEELEELVELAMKEDKDTMSAAQKDDIEKDNDVLIDTLEEEIFTMTDDQKELIKSIVNDDDYEKYLELKQAQKDRWDHNYVEHDFTKAKEEQ